jgi:hypothetical protein
MQQRLLPRHVVVAEIACDKEDPNFDFESLSLFGPLLRALHALLTSRLCSAMTTPLLSVERVHRSIRS